MSEVTRNAIAARKFSSEKMQKVNLFETANFFCDVYCLEPGQEQKVHAHEGADKVYFVLEGTGAFLIGADTYVLGPQETVLASSAVPHGVRNESAERLSVLVFMSPNPNFK